MTKMRNTTESSYRSVLFKLQATPINYLVDLDLNEEIRQTRKHYNTSQKDQYCFVKFQIWHIGNKSQCKMDFILWVPVKKKKKKRQH